MSSTKSGPKIGANLRDEYKLMQKLGGGNFGQIFKGVHLKTCRVAAIKTEQITPEEGLLTLEAKVLSKFQGSPHAPEFYASGNENSFLWFAMELLGPSVGELRKKILPKYFSLSTGLRICSQGISAVRDFHVMTGYLHRDIKPDNLIMGITPKDRQLFLIDYGLSRRFTEKDGGKIRKPRKNPYFRGNLKYAAANVLLGHEACRADDVWGIYYVTIDLLGVAAPWTKKLKINRQKYGKMKLEADMSHVLTSLSEPAAADLLIMMANELSMYAYYDEPAYDKLRKAVDTFLSMEGVTEQDPFDWQILFPYWQRWKEKRRKKRQPRTDIPPLAAPLEEDGDGTSTTTTTNTTTTTTTTNLSTKPEKTRQISDVFDDPNAEAQMFGPPQPRTGGGITAKQSQSSNGRNYLDALYPSTKGSANGNTSDGNCKKGTRF